MSRRATCPGCGAALRISLDAPGEPVRCPECRTVFTTPGGRLAAEADGPPRRAAQTRGVPVRVLVAAVAAALLLGSVLAGGVAYFCVKSGAEPAVAGLPPAHPDVAPPEPAAPRPPDPPPHAPGKGPQPGPKEPGPRKPADPEPARPDEKPEPPAPRPEARLANQPLADWEPGLALPDLSDWVMLPDGVTLIVSLPDEATLVYVDTVSNKESKRAKLPFKPEHLAVQGRRLFASAQGASAVHVLDVDSGAGRKEVKLPGGFVAGMACHPERGPVYLVLSEQHTLHTLDPETGGTAVAGFFGAVPFKFPVPHYPAIRASAQYLAVDPRNANTCYAAYSNGVDKWHEGVHEQAYGQGLQKFLVKSRAVAYPGEAPGMRSVVSVPPGPFQPLERVGVNGRAVPPAPAPGGSYPVRVSRDGRRVGVIGRGEIQLFEADDINAGAGAAKCPDPSDLAFHPVLDLMAVEGGDGGSGPGGGRALYLFDAKALTQVAKITLGPAAGSPRSGRLLAFGARGAELLYYDWSRGGRLRSFPLTLGRADLAALTKAYGAEVRPFQAPGAVEGEGLKVLAKSGDFPINPQDMTPFLVGRWSGNSQLFARPPGRGAWADLELPAPADGRYRVGVYLTRSWDYGVVQFHINGASAGAPVDGFHADTVVSTGPVDLGEVALRRGANTLRVEVVGTNPKSAAPHYSWGLDCVVLQPAR
jgi:hypothetical protein